MRASCFLQPGCPGTVHLPPPPIFSVLYSVKSCRCQMASPPGSPTQVYSSLEIHVRCHLWEASRHPFPFPPHPPLPLRPPELVTCCSSVDNCKAATTTLYFNFPVALDCDAQPSAHQRVCCQEVLTQGPPATVARPQDFHDALQLQEMINSGSTLSTRFPPPCFRHRFFVSYSFTCPSKNQKC